MNFEKFINTSLSKEDYEQLDQYLNCSPHRKTKILRNPAIANNHEVLSLARLLKIAAYSLIKTYGLGTDKLTEIEVDNHKEVMELKKKIEHKNMT